MKETEANILNLSLYSACKLIYTLENKFSAKKNGHYIMIDRIYFLREMNVFIVHWLLEIVRDIAEEVVFLSLNCWPHCVYKTKP